MSQYRRYIRPAQQAIISALEARYAHLSLRFDNGFDGSSPVRASGRIGRRYFYFRFRHDTASLTVGSPLYYSDVGAALDSATRARRRLRRNPDMDSFDRYFYLNDVRVKRARIRHNWYPSYRVRASSISSVTGNEHSGSLDDDQAAYLFERLLAILEPCSQPRWNTSLPQRSYTLPMAPHRVVIVKKSKRRR